MDGLIFLEKKLINYGYKSVVDIFKDNKFQKSIKKVSKELSLRTSENSHKHNFRDFMK